MVDLTKFREIYSPHQHSAKEQRQITWRISRFSAHLYHCIANITLFHSIHCAVNERSQRHSYLISVSRGHEFWERINLGEN